MMYAGCLPTSAVNDYCNLGTGFYYGANFVVGMKALQCAKHSAALGKQYFCTCGLLSIQKIMHDYTPKNKTNDNYDEVLKKQKKYKGKLFTRAIMYSAVYTTCAVAMFALGPAYCTDILRL